MKNHRNFNAVQKMQFLKGFPSNPVIYVRMLDPPWHLASTVFKERPCPTLIPRMSDKH